MSFGMKEDFIRLGVRNFNPMLRQAREKPVQMDRVGYQPKIIRVPIARPLCISSRKNSDAERTCA